MVPFKEVVYCITFIVLHSTSQQSGEWLHQLCTQQPTILQIKSPPVHPYSIFRLIGLQKKEGGPSTGVVYYDRHFDQIQNHLIPAGII